MAKKSIVEQLIEAIAEFIAGFIIICLLLIPFAYMWVGIEGVAILVFIAIVRKMIKIKVNIKLIIK